MEREELRRFLDLGLDSGRSLRRKLRPSTTVDTGKVLGELGRATTMLVGEGMPCDERGVGSCHQMMMAAEDQRTTRLLSRTARWTWMLLRRRRATGQSSQAHSMGEGGGSYYVENSPSLPNSPGAIPPLLVWSLAARKAAPPPA